MHLKINNSQNQSSKTFSLFSSRTFPSSSFKIASFATILLTYKFIIEKTTTPAKTIPTALIKNTANAPVITLTSKRAIPIPITAKGGTNATEIAIPGPSNKSNNSIL